MFRNTLRFSLNGAAVKRFRQEPITEQPLFSRIVIHKKRYVIGAKPRLSALQSLTIWGFLG